MKLILVIFFVLSINYSAFAQNDDLIKKSLKGIKTINVIIDISNELTRLGITEDLIQNTAELRLRHGGLPIKTSTPFLAIEVNCVKTQDSRFVFHMSLSLHELVNLWRNPKDTLIVKTWEKAGFGLVETDYLRIIKEKVEDFVDEFLNDWLAANPK